MQNKKRLAIELSHYPFGYLDILKLKTKPKFLFINSYIVHQTGLCTGLDNPTRKAMRSLVNGM